MADQPTTPGHPSAHRRRRASPTTDEKIHLQTLGRERTAILNQEERVDFVTCENCGAPMTVVRGSDYFFCEYCGAYAFPSPTQDGVVTLGESGDVDCPVCSTRLIEAHVAEVRVLHCPKCHGILAGQEAFSTMVKLLRARASGEPEPVRPVNQEALQREIACPYCGRPLDAHPYYGPGNAVIDNCPRCAVIWLDHGELADIRDAPGRDRGRAQSEDYSLVDLILEQ